MEEERRRVVHLERQVRRTAGELEAQKHSLQAERDSLQRARAHQQTLQHQTARSLATLGEQEASFRRDQQRHARNALQQQAALQQQRGLGFISLFFFL